MKVRHLILDARRVHARASAIVWIVRHHKQLCRPIGHDEAFRLSCERARLHLILEGVLNGNPHCITEARGLVASYRTYH